METETIRLTPDELNRLQAKLDEPMTLEDAEEILQEFGYIDSTLAVEGSPFRMYLQPVGTNITACANEQEVLALAEKVLNEEIA